MKLDKKHESFRTVYEDFNARHMSPRDVADKFVPCDEFKLLWQHKSVLLMGPRGSGKTTLMKMLTPEALHSWSHRDADAVKQQIDYHSVYIPYDLHWRHQLSFYEKQLQRTPRFARRFSECAVTTTIIWRAVRTMEELVRLDPTEAANIPAESSLCECLIEAMKLDRTVPAFVAVEEKLLLRLSEIRMLCNRIADTCKSDNDVDALPAFFYLDYLDVLRIICRRFNHSYPAISKSRWALLFDELELAPRWFQERVANELRSTDELFYFKLSTTPIPEFLENSEARPRQDFEPIRLWRQSKIQKRQDDFFDALFQSIMERKGIKGLAAETVFGRCSISEDREDTPPPHPYRRGSDEWRDLKEEADRDPSIRSILERYKIDPSDPSTDDISIRDSVLRKLKPIVTHRRAFNKYGESEKARARSRKFVGIYSGKEAIFDMADGNPRWLIGLTNDLAREMRETKSNEIKRIRATTQARILTRASNQFNALIKTIPNASARNSQTDTTTHLSSILSTIGDYFFQQQVRTDATLDPVGSFTIDSWISDELVRVLRLAIDHGAIVYVDPDDIAFDSSLRGKRFRLSYMLAPAYKLTFRLYAARALSTCLQNTKEFRRLESGHQLLLGVQDET